MPHLSQPLVGLATMAPNSVRFRIALGLLALGAACSAPAPAALTPTAVPAMPTQPAATIPPATSAPPRTRPTIASTPAAELNADQRAMFASARLALVEADYAAAAQRFQAVLPLTPDAR